MADNNVFLQKTKSFFVKTLEWLKTRWIGFYLLIPAAILSFIIPFVYMDGFFDTLYKNAGVFVIPFFATLSIALACFKPTARYAPVAMFFFNLLFVLLFVETAYMYLSTAFFGGIAGNIFKQAGFAFSFCAVAPIVNMIICAVAMFFRQYKDEKNFFGGVRLAREECGEEGTNE